MKHLSTVVSTMRTAALAVAFGVCVGDASPALAQTSDPAATFVETPAANRTGGDDSWDITLGAGGGVTSAYPGSRALRGTGVPMFSISYRDTVFLNAQGLGINVVDTHGFKTGPILTYDVNRDEKWDTRLRGMGDVEYALAGGAFLSYGYGPFDVTTIVKQAITHMNYGLSGSVEANYHGSITSDLSFQIGPDMEFGNANFERTWFGVSSDQSQRSGLRAYHARAGVQDVGVHAGLTYNWSAHSVIQIFAGAKELVSSAADSPLVQRKTEALAGLGIAYHF